MSNLGKYQDQDYDMYYDARGCARHQKPFNTKPNTILIVAIQKLIPPGAFYAELIPGKLYVISGKH